MYFKAPLLVSPLSLKLNLLIIIFYYLKAAGKLAAGKYKNILATILRRK